MADFETTRRREIAVGIMTRNIRRISGAWDEIKLMDETFPDLPVGNHWDTIRRVNDEMRAMIKTWKTSTEKDK